MLQRRGMKERTKKRSKSDLDGVYSVHFMNNKSTHSPVGTDTVKLQAEQFTMVGLEDLLSEPGPICAT